MGSHTKCTAKYTAHAWRAQVLTGGQSASRKAYSAGSKSVGTARHYAIAAAPLPPILYRLCKSGWGVIVDRAPNAQGTRFVCPFCPVSHRVPGPVRGFRKMRRPQWLKLRKVGE